MILGENIEKTLRDFVRDSEFKSAGAVITDLDGTAVHEYKGSISIPDEVELALLRHYKDGRPVVLNSLRFPLSVIRTFGKDWYNLSKSPIPTVTLNGSLIGYIKSTATQELEFEELAAFPLSTAEVNHIIHGVASLIEGGIRNLLVFYYPRDWRIGEVIWTPIPENVIAVKEKYLSASAVTAVELPKLLAQMNAEDICMIFLLIDAPADQLMAYQHTKPTSFFTHEGIDKLSGARIAANLLQFKLAESVGAGDTEMDQFLSGVGLAVIVGNNHLNYYGVRETVKLNSSFELGALLFRLSELTGGLA